MALKGWINRLFFNPTPDEITNFFNRNMVKGIVCHTNLRNTEQNQLRDFGMQFLINMRHICKHLNLDENPGHPTILHLMI